MEYEDNRAKKPDAKYYWIKKTESIGVVFFHAMEGRHMLVSTEPNGEIFKIWPHCNRLSTSPLFDNEYDVYVWVLSELEREVNRYTAYLCGAYNNKRNFKMKYEEEMHKLYKKKKKQNKKQ